MEERKRKRCEGMGEVKRGEEKGGGRGGTREGEDEERRKYKKWRNKKS